MQDFIEILTVFDFMIPWLLYNEKSNNNFASKYEGKTLCVFLTGNNRNFLNYLKRDHLRDYLQKSGQL